MKNRKMLWIAVALLLFAAVKVAALFWWQGQQSPREAIACDVKQGCVLPNGGKLTFSSSLGLKTAFSVQLSDVQAQEVSLSFSMKGMDMGFNRYDLKAQNQLWRAENVRLPLCTQERHDFIADVNIDGKIYQIPFSAY
ncbi:MAG: hypothetical protein Q4E16_01240 [Neisseria sp.]|nr:hypothetical protein [Neisseria sp.]